MISFLSGFLGNLPATQSKQIVRILSQQKDRGEIRTQQEFQQKLLELSRLIQAGELNQQTPPLFMREGELMESDAFRTFFDLARLDNEAILRQIEHLGDTIRAHRRILEDSYYSAIESALDELESEATAYEVLENQKFSGFSRVIRSWDFTTMGGVASGDPESSSFIALRETSRGGETLHYTAPINGDPGLHLAIRREDPIIRRFDSLGLQTDATTPQTEFEVNTSSNSPNNAINGDLDVGWNHSILLDDYVDTCRLKVELSFSGAKRINAINIQGMPRIPMTLYSASYVDSGGQSHSLNIGSSVTSVVRNGLLGTHDPAPARWRINHARKIFPIPNVTARKVIITLQQDTAVPGDFFYSEEIGDWERQIDLDVAARFAPAAGTLPHELGYLPDRPFSTGFSTEELTLDTGDSRRPPDFSGRGGGRRGGRDESPRRGGGRRGRGGGGLRGSRRQSRTDRDVRGTPEVLGSGRRGRRRGRSDLSGGGDLGFEPQENPADVPDPFTPGPRPERDPTTMVLRVDRDPGREAFFALEPGGSPEDRSETPYRASFVEYSFGIRDIYAMEMEYFPNGTFIPESISFATPPETLAFYTDAEFPMGENTSFEILMRKENYDEDGIQLDVETLPILPFGSSSINERMYFTRREDSQVIRDVAQTRFFPDLDEIVTVYRGGEALTIGTDYEISVDDGVTWETELPVAGTEGVPPKFLVKIIEPRTDTIFTIEYTPKLSVSDVGGELWLTAQRKSRLGRNQIYVFDNSRPAGSVDRCVVTLQIIARANTLNTRVSPFLKNLVILGG